MKLNNSFLFTHKWIWLFLSLYFLCFSSPLSFSTTASLSLITSLCHGGHILAWVRHGLLKLTDDGLLFLADDGLLKLDDDGLGFVCVVRWWWRWSSGSDAMSVVFCVFWSALIWVLLNNSVCVFFDGILVEVLLNNCLGFDWVCSRLIWGFLFIYLFFFFY